MNQSLNLNEVIRLVTLEEANRIRRGINQSNDKVVRIDMKNGEILYKKPLFGFRRYIRYYWVSTQKIAEASVDVTIKDFSSNLSIIIHLFYEVKCEKGKEEKVVLSLYRGNYPIVVFNQIIQGKVQEFIAMKRKSGVNPVLEYFHYQEELKRYLVEEIKQIVGLDMEVILTLKNEEKLDTLMIKSDEFIVRVRDCDDELKLKFEATINVSEKNRIYAILNYPYLNELDSFIREKIKRFILENILLHDFVYGLHHSVKNRLISILNSELELKGRKIAWLRLDGLTGSATAENTLNIYHTVNCDIKDYSKKIEVEHRLLMQLDDIGKYKANKREISLNDWVKEKLNEITRNALFEKRYIDILLDFEKVEKDREALKIIKTEMRQFSESIGYSVKHLIVEPNMKPLIIKRDGFLVQKVGEFSTLNNRVNVKLDIVVTGKLNDLSKIPHYITPDKDIIHEMEQVIYYEAEKQMHNVDPQKFYMPFKYPDEESIEDILKMVIEERLQKIFFAGDVTVIIKRMETDVIQRILNLINSNPYQIYVDVIPLRGGGIQEKVTFEVEFLVETVSRWNTFIYKNFESYDHEIERIKQALNSNIAGNFQTVPFEVLKYTKHDNSRKLLEVARTSQAKIASIFGLDIIISDVRRKATMTESAQQKILTEKVRTQTDQEIAIIGKEKDVTLEKVDKLHGINLQYLDPEFSDEEPKEYAEKELEEIKRRAKETSIEGSEVFKLPTQVSSQKWSPDEYKDDFKEKLDVSQDEDYELSKRG